MKVLTVSIITATYNSHATIRDTLTSVASQDHPGIEHLIIDGMSTDGTLEIIKTFNHVARLVSEKDNGIYDAMNKGIQRATGDIIGILNSDDFYASQDVISRVVKTFKDTDCEAVYGDLVYVHKSNTSKIIRYWKAGQYNEGSFKWGWMPPHPTFFVKKEIYLKHGIFKSQMKTAADYELMLRLIHKEKIKIVYIPRVLIKMMVGGASNQSFSHRLRASMEDSEAWKVNRLSPFWFTMILKPLRKVFQFFVR